MRVWVARDAEEAAAGAAALIGVMLCDALARRELATLALSGGSSPLGLYDAMARVDLDWPRVHVFQVDERWVSFESADRNARAIVDRLVEPAGARFTPLTVEGRVAPEPRRTTILDDAAALESVLGHEMQLDVVHLGLGSDGHTASWPPGPAGAEMFSDPAAVIDVPGFNGHDRTTLGPALVARARNVVWFVPGESKRAMLERLLAGDRSIPAGRVALDDAVLFTDLVIDA